MAEEYQVVLSYDNETSVTLDSSLNNQVDSNFTIETTQARGTNCRRFR